MINKETEYQNVMKAKGANVNSFIELYALLEANQIEPLTELLNKLINENKLLDKELSFVFKEHKPWNVHQKAIFYKSAWFYIQHLRLISAFLNISQQPGYKAIRNSLFALQKTNVKSLLSFAEKQVPAIKYSISDWLLESITKDYDVKADEIITSLLWFPTTYLRINTAKTNSAELTKILKEERIQVKSTAITNCLEVEKGEGFVFKSNAFKEGLFEVQDITSQHVGTLVNIKPGQQVIDVCAGNGGKSLQMAAALQNKGRIIATDIYANKLEVLRKRATRAGVSVIETRHIENTKTLKRLSGKFDVVLIDAPCSGTGVIRRNPDTKWHLNQDKLNSLIGIQQELLMNQAELCKIKGQLTYVTCSILKSEGEDQIKKFLSVTDGFELTSELRVFPDEFNGDAFYMATLKRLK